MPFEVKKIDPLDLQPRKAVGVSLPFSGKAVFNQTFETKEAIKNNLIHFFLTGIGERYMNPTFGSGLRPLLFENVTREKVLEIDNHIKQALATYFPRVEVKNLELNAEPDRNLVEFTLEYAIRNSNIEDELIINFEQ